MLTYIWIGGWFAWLIWGDSSSPSEAEGINRAWIFAVGTAVTFWIDYRASAIREREQRRDAEAILHASREAWKAKRDQ